MGHGLQHTHGDATQAQTGDPLRVRQMLHMQKSDFSGPHELMSASDQRNGAKHARDSW